MKHLYRLIFLSITFCLLVFTAQAQEICDNGIDDDGNGLIDCADPAASCYLFQDCSKELDCGNGVDDDGDGFVDYYDGDCFDDPNNPNDYITIKPDCEAVPVGNVFEIEAAWDSEVSPNPTSGALGMPSVADLDQDGIPEVITMNSETGWMYILDGRDGSTLRKVRVKSGKVFAYPAVADVDGDGFGEIFTIDLNGVIRVYEHNLTLKWTQTSVFTGFGRSLGLADFNHDGKAELYSVNEIWDAETGALLIQGSHGSSMYPSANDWQTELNAVPAAVNILPSANLELVVGHIIYEVTITNAAGTAGNSLSEAKNMNSAATKPAGYAGYFPADADYGNQTFSQTAVVDYDLDGNLDVIVGGANGGIDGATTAFYWNLASDEIKMFTVLRPGNTIPNKIVGTFADIAGGTCDNSGGSTENCYWKRGLGNINIADIDNDGQLEATFMSGSSLYALETDFTEKWGNHIDFWESSSGVTGTTVFDFDGDGSSEVVYRDEIDLYIIDGTTGNKLNSQISGTFCSSQTQGDYPIVADVDGDGETEIIVSCGLSENIFGEDPATSATRTSGFIRAYKAAGNNYWVPSRALWNQTNYFNVNINDNLTVPRYQQSHHINFAQICSDPNAPASFSLNKFLNQSPRISFCGQLTFPSPKLDFADDGVIIIPPVCPDNQFEVRLVFQNNGSQDISKPVPISFYAANPTNSYSNTDESPYLETINIDVSGGIAVGQKVDTLVIVNADRGAFTLFVSLNDIGQNDSTGAPMTNEDFYPLTKLNGTIRECDDTPTIVSKAVTPLPFQVKAVKIRDNRNCPGEVAYNNGEIQVLRPDDTPFSASDFSFTWTDIATNTVISNDALVTGLDAGTYQVVVEHNRYGCFGNADTVTVLRFEDWPDTQVITLEELQAVSSCAPGTADGIARILINGLAVDESQYEIEWEEEQQAGVLAIGDTATNLRPILYKVTVTNKLTGCSESETIDMSLDLPQLATPLVEDNTNCLNPNGTITAQLLSGNVADYEYMLIQLSPAQDTTFNGNDPKFVDLAKGFYELRAYNPTTDCGRYSKGLEVEIEDGSSIDDLTAVVEKSQTACEAPYTGQLRANIANPADYNFVWYLGTITSGPSAVVVGNAALTEHTLGTNITDQYTVVATNPTTGCFTSAVVTLTESIVYPTPDINNFTINDQTKCNPNGSIQAAVVSPQSGVTYTYRLLQGSTELASNTSGLFENLEAGPYVITIENDDTHCTSNPTAGGVYVDYDVDPFGAITRTETPVTNCDATAPNGALSLSLAGGNANYSFKWFVGVDTLTAYLPKPPDATAHQLSDIAAGDYIVRITNKTSGCITTDTLVLEDKSADFQEQIIVTKLKDQEYCTPGIFSGEIQASLLQSTSGGAPDASNYTFYWYLGRKNDLRNGTVVNAIAGENSATIDGLDEGWYSVRAVRNDGSQCHALDTAEVRIDDARALPITDINVTVVKQSSCDSNDPNGSLEGNVGGNITDYTFTWYQLDNGIRIDIGDLNPNPIISGNKVSNIGVGDYVLVVENTTTGCSDEKQVHLNDNVIKGSEIKLNLLSEKATFCTPPNGVAYVNTIDLSEDGGLTFTMTDDPNNYTYQWYYGEDTSLPVDPLINPTALTSRLEDIDPGKYTVVANNKFSSCLSVSYSVIVGSEIQDQLAFDFKVDKQSDCVNPNGGLEVENLTGGTGPFAYQWYKGGNDTYLLAGETNPRIEQIRTDRYMVRITDQASGCFKDSVYVLPATDGITPVPPPMLSIIEHVDTCVPGNNGRLVGEVDANLLTDPGSVFFGYNAGDFFYYWFKGENPNYINPAASPIDDISNFDLVTALPTIGDNKAEINNLEPGFYTVIVIDAKDHVASGGIVALGCRSTPTTFEVKALAKSPEATFITMPDTYCVGDNGETTITIGKRAVDVTNFTGFSITDATKDGNVFFPLPGTVVQTSSDDVVAKETEITLEGLGKATYQFVLTDNTTQCDTTITVGIGEITTLPNLTADNIVVNNHKTSCNPNNGELEVVNSLTGITDITQYNFYWHTAVQSTSADIITNAIQTGPVASGLDVGTYYVYAVNIASGCISSPKSKEIKDQVPSTIIEIVSDSPDRNCDPMAAGTGTINVRIHDEDVNGIVLYPVSGYTISWTDEVGTDISAQATTNGGAQPATSVLPDLSAGVYTIRVENNDTQCGFTIARDTIRSEPYFPKFTAASAQITHSTTCDGNGEITIGQIKENNTVILATDPAFANYSFEWRYSDDVTVVEDGASVPITTNTISDLLPGTYYVYVINNSTGGCTSPANKLQMVIRDESKLPLIYQQEKIDFISCTGINEGVIEVLGGEFNPANVPALGYQYDWTMADGSPVPAYAIFNADQSRISNLTAGTYRVTMTNLSTGCSQTADYTLKTSVVLPVLTVTKIADQSYCFGNGEAEVTSVKYRSNNLNLNDFTFYWYESDQVTAIPTPQYGLSVDSLRADELSAGIYFVIAEDKVNGCKTFPVQVEIKDISEPLIVLLDDISEPIVGCDPQNIAEGEIEIEVRNSDNFITRWYAGSTITDPAANIVAYDNSLEIEDLVPGTYSVWVQDTVTGCSVVRKYTIEGIEVSITLSTSAIDVRSCIQPDGKIAANINGGSGEYMISWYKGNGVDLQPIANTANNTFVEGLADGTYTIIVKDKLDPFCDEMRAEVLINDKRGEETILMVSNDFQMTNCDESVPNGQLSVAVSSGELSRYNFFWYAGTDTNNKPIATGPVIAKLVPGAYTVLARDKVTGCISMPFTGEVTSLPDTTIIPAPVVSTTPVTHCSTPNGTATAILDSAFIDPDVDYAYTWFNEKGEMVFSSIRKNTANFLAEGDYTVVATNVNTGCSSEGTAFTIGEDIYIPEFEIVSTPSTCLEPNGSIRLELVEAIKIVDIEWLTPDGFATGFFLANQPAGMYEVTITDDKGCQHTKTAEIKSNIHVYNGVSANGDGKNDKFIISCIEQYRENIVRIYNRTGAIVYEEFNYDNERVYFEGLGNRGLYIGGEKLPEGTYYYIVDKQNGEKPVSGYLELLR